MKRRVEQYSPDYRHFQQQSCPWCGHLLDTVGQANAAVCELPEAGDVTVCIECAEASIFLASGQLRKARPEELDEEICGVQADIRRMQAGGN